MKKQKEEQKDLIEAIGHEHGFDYHHASGELLGRRKSFAASKNRHKRTGSLIDFNRQTYRKPLFNE